MGLRSRFIVGCLSLSLGLAAAPAVAQTRPAFGGLRIHSFIDEPDSYFQSAEGQSVADNIVGWQNANGGWFKNYDPRVPRPAVLVDDPKSGPPGDDDSVWHKVSTIDNDATYSELRILGRAARVLKKPAYEQAFDRGLKYLLSAQFPNGGWPQRFPLQDNYGRHITLNDGAMLGVLELLRDVADAQPDFAFEDAATRATCRAAMDRGIQCVLDCQIHQNGKLTAWSQQNDEVTLAPAGARTYELPSVTGGESSDIIQFLMEIDPPTDRIKTAIEAGVAWYDSSKITGKRYTTRTGPDYQNGRDRVLSDDPTAPPLWARFYDLLTNQPFFCSRDGVKRSSVDQISYERRNGYAWYGQWGTTVEQAYAKWKARVAAEPSIAPVK